MHSMNCAAYMTAIRAKTATGSVYAAAKLLGINEQTVCDAAHSAIRAPVDGAPLRVRIMPSANAFFSDSRAAG